MANAKRNVKRNIIFVLTDTVRSVDVYGNGSLANLGYLARNGVVYANAVAPGTWTAPTHASIFANRNVSRIRHVSRDLFTNGTRKIDPWFVRTKFLPGNSITLASKMATYGYTTALFSNNPFLSSYTNLAIGFDKIYDLWMETNAKEGKELVKKLSFIIKGGAKAREAMFNISNAIAGKLPAFMLDRLYLYLRRKLDEGVANADGTYSLDRGAKYTEKIINSYMNYIYNGSPLFMFINYIEAHENYPVSRSLLQDKWLYLAGIEQLDEGTAKKLHSAYLRRIKYLDWRIGKLLGTLKQNGILENATVIIASDHGQAFGEHGLLYHSLPPYEEITKVPLIAANYENGKLVKMKDSVETPVSILALHDALVDLASSREEYLNGNMRKDRYVFSEHTGISEGWDEQLLRMLKKNSNYARMIYGAKSRFNMRATAIYKGNLKLVHHFGAGKDELYDLLHDAKESTNIIDSRRGKALEMLHAYYNMLGKREVKAL